MAILDFFANIGGFLTNINVLFYIIAYLLGGVPFGMLLAKKFAGVNIKEAGSKSIGATNVLRVVKNEDTKLAKKLAIATIVLDALKAVVPLLFGTLLGLEANALWFMGILSLLGHCFSPYLGFEGGKGVATGAGVVLFLIPVPALIAIFVWFVGGKLFKVSSIASLLALSALIISVLLIHKTIPEVNSFTPLVIMVIIIVYKHIPNIIRLIKKEEQKVV